MGAQEIAETATIGGLARPGRFELSPPDDAIGLPIARGKAEQQPRTRSVTPAHPFMICPTRQVRCRARSECMRAMRKLPVVPICRNPTALPLPPNQRQIPRHPASIRGTYRDRHGRWARDAMDAIAAQTSGVNADGEVVWS
jgi:hypothetical protein